MVAARQVIPIAAVILLPLNADCTVNPNNEPTVQSILDAVSEANILHLASHGTQVSVHSLS
jgi:hypothetical protein